MGIWANSASKLNPQISGEVSKSYSYCISTWKMLSYSVGLNVDVVQISR